MRKWVLLVVAILGVLAIMGWAVTICLMHSIDPMQAGGGSGNYSVGKTTVQYMTFGSDQRVALVILSDAPGDAGSSGESGLFKISYEKGFLTSAEGKRIEWEWTAPRDKGGDFRLDGAAYDLTNGTLFLVATNGGQVRVTQLDVDLTKFPIHPDAKRSEAVKDWAKNSPKIAKFIAEVEGKK
jgi:hypothetical protein